MWKRGAGGGGDDHSSKCSTIDQLTELELATLESSSGRHQYLPQHHHHHQPSLGASSVDSHEGLLLHPSESWELAAEDQIMVHSKPLLLTPPRSVSVHAAHDVTTIFEGDEGQLLRTSHSGDGPLLQPSLSDELHDRYLNEDGDDDEDDDDDDEARRAGVRNGDDEDDLYEFEDESDSRNDDDEDNGDSARYGLPPTQHLRSSLVEPSSTAVAGPSWSSTPNPKPGFVSALLDSAIPLDLRDNTVGIVKGDYRVERKTLLHHATTSDNYDLFSHKRRANFRRGADGGGGATSGSNSVDTAEASKG
jgi:hypothetical protein